MPKRTVTPTPGVWPGMPFDERRKRSRQVYVDSEFRYRGFHFNDNGSTASALTSPGSNIIQVSNDEWDVSDPILDPSHSWRDGSNNERGVFPSDSRAERLMVGGTLRTAWNGTPPSDDHWRSMMTLTVSDGSSELYLLYDTRQWYHVSSWGYTHSGVSVIDYVTLKTFLVAGPPWWVFMYYDWVQPGGHTGNQDLTYSSLWGHVLD